MPTQLQELIITLYNETATPRNAEVYLANPDIISYIDHVFIRIGKRHPSYHLLELDVRDLILFVLKLMDTRINLEGSLLAESPVCYITDKALTASKAPDQLAEQFIAIRDAWFSILRKAPKHARKFYEHKPNYEACPLLTFHIAAYKDSLLPDKTAAPLYVAYAFKLHTLIRFNQQQKIDADTHLAYVRPARYFFQYLSPHIKFRKHHNPDKIERSYIQDFIRNLRNARSLTSDTVKTHIKHFRGLISKKLIRSHSRISLKTSHNLKLLASSGPPNMIPEGYPGPPRFLIHGLPTDHPSDIYALLDSIEDFDFNFVSFPDDTGFLSRPERSDGFARAMDYIHIRNYLFYWDAQFLNLFHYAVLYHAITSARKSSEKNKAIARYLSCLIHTGIDSQALIDAVPASGHLDPHSVGIKYIDGRMYILNPAIIKPKATELDLSCFPTSTHVHIPVPSIIAEHIPADIMSRSYLFSFLHENKEIHLTRYDVDAFLANVNASFKAYGLSITTGYIENAFLPLYSSRCGLDPVIGCHISGDDRHKLYGAQLHYIYIPHAFLEKGYLDAFAAVDKRINMNLIECIKLGLIDDNIRPFKAPKSYEQRNFANFLGYGSVSAVKASSIGQLVSSLHRAVTAETNLLNRHNLFCCYLFFAMQFSMGHRPRAKLQIPWSSYSAHSSVLLVKDKDSAEHYEKRFLRCPPLLDMLLREFIAGLARLDGYIHRNHCISDQSYMFDRILFLIDKNGKYVDFTPEAMLEILKEASISYPYPMNMPRHFLRNYLYHTGFDHDLADAMMGHQRDGREITNVTSCTIYGNWLNLCQREVSKMLDKVGFKEVSYLPPEE